MRFAVVKLAAANNAVLPLSCLGAELMISARNLAG